MKITCMNCGNTQDYYPKIINDKLSKTTSTRCKSCRNIIRVSKKKIRLSILEIREHFIIYQTDINTVRDKEVLRNFWNIKNLYPLDIGIVQVKMRDFNIFLEKFENNDSVIIYGEIKIKKFKKLSHIEMYGNKINFLFRKLLPNEKMDDHLEECKNLSIQIQKCLIDYNGSPQLVQPLDIGYLKKGYHYILGKKQVK